jgi:DNA-binding Lrp family transcriptional regulator
MASWSFLTNHGLVLTYLGRYPDSTGLAIAQAVGITERAARRIVADLLAEAYIEREKVGRRNRYRLNTALPLPYPGERTITVGELLGLLWRDRNTPSIAGAETTSPRQMDEDGSQEEAVSPMPSRQAQGAR